VAIKVIESNNMQIKPLSDHIVIEPISQEEKTKSGIFLPQTVEKERPEQGKVVAVGPGKMLSSGKRGEMEVKKGDVVLFSKYGPNEIKVENKNYLIAKLEDILAILE
jgi:chaperonin GroES